MLSLTDAGAAPVLLFGNDTINQFYFDPVWTATDASIYYVSYRSQPALAGSKAEMHSSAAADKAQVEVDLYRYDIDSKQHVHIAKDGIWPRVSKRDDRLVYIHVDLSTDTRTIRIANKDDAGAGELFPANTFTDVDTPIFSPDGAWIYFAAVPTSTTVSDAGALALIDGLLGLSTARAHSGQRSPSDWWRVAVTGGKPERVTTTRGMWIGEHSERDHPRADCCAGSNRSISSNDSLNSGFRHWHRAGAQEGALAGFLDGQQHGRDIEDLYRCYGQCVDGLYQDRQWQRLSVHQGQRHPKLRNHHDGSADQGA